MKKFKSKLGIGLVIFLTIFLGGTSTIMFINHIWPGLIIILLLTAFVCYMLSTTYYVIKGHELIIKSGFMVNATIKIENIKKIKETNTTLSSPANSLDRIAIYYNNFESIMISPKDKMNFIKQLIEVNPKIEIIPNNKK